MGLKTAEHLAAKSSSRPAFSIWTYAGYCLYYGAATALWSGPEYFGQTNSWKSQKVVAETT